MITAELDTEKLNMEKLSALYDRIYDIADRLLKKHNPCNIHTEIQPHHLFPTKLKEETVCTSWCTHSLCCSSCNHWDKGCTVKCLGCKLFLCSAITNKILQMRFRKLRKYGRTHLNFNYNDSNWGNQTFTYSAVDKYYQSKEDWLKLLEEVNG